MNKRVKDFIIYSSALIFYVMSFLAIVSMVKFWRWWFFILILICIDIFLGSILALARGISKKITKKSTSNLMTSLLIMAILVCLAILEIESWIAKSLVWSIVIILGLYSLIQVCKNRNK